MITCRTNNNIPVSGRLGNQLMRLMSLMGMSTQFECNYAIPDWPYAKYFTGPINQVNIPSADLLVKEPSFEYTPDHWARYNLLFKTSVVDIDGFLQSPKYWQPALSEIRTTLSFDPVFLSLLKSKFTEALSKKPIAISVRRGDFVNNPNYYQLPVSYYMGALKSHFDFSDRNVILFSDDIDFCKMHFRILPSVFYADGSDIEQLALMSLCDDYIISNSTFSYCGAWLSQNKNAIVIRPKKIFDGLLARRNSEKDYWPEEWVMFDHELRRVS